MGTILGRRRTAPMRAAIRGERMTQPPQPTHDAPMLNFGNGVAPRARFASAEEYSIQGRLGEVERRIDTAPLHAELSTFPNYRHGPDDSVSEDTLTLPGRAISGRTCARYSMQSSRSLHHKSKV